MHLPAALSLSLSLSLFLSLLDPFLDHRSRSFSLPLYLSIYLSNLSIYLSIYIYIYISIYLSLSIPCPSAIPISIWCDYPFRLAFSVFACVFLPGISFVRAPLATSLLQLLLALLPLLSHLHPTVGSTNSQHLREQQKYTPPSGLQLQCSTGFFWGWCADCGLRTEEKGDFAAFGSNVG